MIEDDKVSHEKLESELEKYTRLTRFIRVEELQETYFTKKLNNLQNDDL